jgi:pimeloyl-ACP methyl ester carboxylesterase
LASCVVLIAGASEAAGTPSTLFKDPPHDVAHPARMEVVHIPTHGVSINGVFYLASGAGLHPTLIFFHGLPGNEQGLDLAQAVRRLGWNVLTLHYRGSWGSPGTYSYAHLIEDGIATLAFVRDPETATRYGIDPRRIVLGGHSTGGFVAVNTAARSSGLAGLVLVSASDDAEEALTARRSQETWARFVKETFADGMESLQGCTPDGLGEEVLSGAQAWRFKAAAPKLTTTPIIMITANDGLASEDEAFAAAVRAHGGHVKVTHFDTDHPYSDRRIALARSVAQGLGSIK